MGSLFRSEPMALCQLFLQGDSAFESAAELGELGVCQFRDLNTGVSSFQRKYVNEVKRCDEMERKIRFIEKELEKQGVPVPDPGAEDPVGRLPRDLNGLDEILERLEEEIHKINNSVDALHSNYQEISEVRHVLRQLQILFQEDHRTHAFQSISEAESGFGPIELHATNGGMFGVNKPRTESTVPIIPRTNELRFLAGIVPADRVPAFERVLWRMCHGKVFLRAQNIDPDFDSPFSEQCKKSAFVLFFSGDSLLPKVRRICESFRANIVENCPESSIAREEMLRSVTFRLTELNTVIGVIMEHRDRLFRGAAVNIKEWEIQVRKLKAIFHTLNLFSLDVTQKCLIAECWIPLEEISTVRAALQDAMESTGSSVSSVVNRLEGDELSGHGTPPTFHRLNKFTRAFQNIVDAYGIANYGEINPAPWTIVTFPFLFAVMFGDSGHGLIMLLAALGLILFERRIESARIRDEIFNTFYGGRYVILLMGIFSIYTGMIYNDVFSKSVNLFGSHWRNNYSLHILSKYIDQEAVLELPPNEAFLHGQGSYWFGLDPVWNLAEKNRLSFVNPMKMKASVILGVSQMFFGVVLSLLNFIHFRSHLDIFFVFVPQLLFLSLIFVYLCVQIILKWLFFWVQPGQVLGQFYPGPGCAPSLLVGLINMFMFKERKQGFTRQGNNSMDSWELYPQCYLQLWYPSQGTVENSFMLIAILCIPVMLLVKPLWQWHQSRKGHSQAGAVNGQHRQSEFNLGDVFVYQAIHTIEFALGCISHTASYLRLWALSLAHAQLSEVLWTMVMRQAFAQSDLAVGAVANFVIFWVFGVLSVAILVLMEGLSAFLHALRLHWVEFQSKFYGGTGIPFEPFSFEQIINKHEGTAG